MRFEDESETAIFAEPFPVDTILVTDVEAIIVGDHLFMTYFAERPEYVGYERHLSKVVVARIAMPLPRVPPGRMKITLALAHWHGGGAWPEADAGHG